MRHSIVLSVFAWLTLAESGLAQVDGWEQVRAVQRGRTVQVKRTAGKSVRGRLDECRVDGLTVKGISIMKSEIAQVALVIGRSRATKALIAGSVAGGATAGLTGAVVAQGDCCEMMSPSGTVAVSSLFVGGIAAGIAALFGPHYEVIYRAGPVK